MILKSYNFNKLYSTPTSLIFSLTGLPSESYFTLGCPTKTIWEYMEQVFTGQIELMLSSTQYNASACTMKNNEDTG